MDAFLKYLLSAKQEKGYVEGQVVNAMRLTCFTRILENNLYNANDISVDKNAVTKGSRTLTLHFPLEQ